MTTRKQTSRSGDFHQAFVILLAPLPAGVEVTTISSLVHSARSPKSRVDIDANVVIDDTEPPRLEDVYDTTPRDESVRVQFFSDKPRFALPTILILSEVELHPIVSSK